MSLDFLFSSYPFDPSLCLSGFGFKFIAFGEIKVGLLGAWWLDLGQTLNKSKDLFSSWKGNGIFVN